MRYGEETYMIRDQYFQNTRLDVTVEDTILVLSHDILELKDSNSQYISARESYQGIKSFVKSNDNIRVIKKVLEDGEEVLEVFPEHEGETDLLVSDYQDNVDSVKVIVGGNSQTWGETGSGSTGTGSIIPEEQELQLDMDSILQSLGLENLEINTAWIEINSAANAFRCELWNTGKYFVKPQYASCVEWNNSMAWKCNVWYTDLDYIGINTCVKNENLKYNDQLSVLIREDEREIKLNWDGINSRREVILSTYNTRLNTKTSQYITNFRDKIITVRELVVSSQQYSQVTKDMVVFILDDLLNELDNKVDQQIKDEKDIKASWNQLLMYTNNGYIWEFQSTWFRGVSRSKIESEASIFATKLENYLYTYSDDYKTWLNAYVSQLSTSSWDSLAEITTWAREWVKEGVRDYIMGYYDTVQTLSDLKLDDIKTWVKWLWSKITNPVATLTSIYSSYSETITNLYNTVSSMSWYEKSKWGSYLGTNISLSTADPVGKIVQLSWWVFFFKIGKYINLLRKISFIKKIKYNDIQLQTKYDAHATDFWITDNYNLVNREKFKQALIKHSNDLWTEIKRGTYRTTQQVEHFYNVETWINVMYDLDWNFISWWKLWQSQIDNLLRNWNIQ